MTVQVKALTPIQDTETGQTLVPAGLIGTVIDVKQPPNLLLIKCQWTVGEVDQVVWVPTSSIAFLDGAIGLLKAFLEVSNRTVTSVSYPSPPGDYAPLLNDRPVAYAGKIKLICSDGLEISFASNRNSGDIDITIGGNVLP